MKSPRTELGGTKRGSFDRPSPEIGLGSTGSSGDFSGEKGALGRGGATKARARRWAVWYARRSTQGPGHPHLQLPRVPEFCATEIRASEFRLGGNAAPAAVREARFRKFRAFCVRSREVALNPPRLLRWLRSSRHWGKCSGARGRIAERRCAFERRRNPLRATRYSPGWRSSRRRSSAPRHRAARPGSHKGSRPLAGSPCR